MEIFDSIMVVLYTEVHLLCLLLSLRRYYGDRDTKMGHSVFRSVLRKEFLHFAIIFISNFVENVFLKSSISGSETWECIVFV